MLPGHLPGDERIRGVEKGKGQSKFGIFRVEGMFLGLGFMIL